MSQIVFDDGTSYPISNNAFRPVKCKSTDLERISPVEGYVYFTTDTKKIFCGFNGKFEPMGGTSGVFYGIRQLTDDEKYGDQVVFNFLPSEIDSKLLPAIDDLILNIPDGGFYRVLQSDSTRIQAQRLAISGGGGGGGGVSNEGTLQINFITPQYASTITGVEYSINFEVVAKDSAGDLVAGTGTATWIINGVQYSSKVRNGENSFRVDEYLDATLDNNEIKLIVSMDTGGSANSIVSKTWYITAVDLRLEWPWNYSADEYKSGSTFTLSWIPYGNVNCVTHMVFDGNYEEGVTYFKREVLARETGKTVVSDAMPSLDYGVHTCEMYVTTTVNDEPYQTPSIFREITFTKDGTSTLLTVPFYEKTAKQYDTVNIPFLVWDPDSETCAVSFYVNDARISGDSFDRSLHYWPYTITNAGPIKLTIKSDNGDAYKDINLMASALNLDTSEVAGAAFSLKANAFSSNDELRNWNSNDVTLTFSDNFDWKNGGLKFETLSDGSIEKYICVRQGTRMTINYKLFENFTTGSSGGKDFKFCFKATNCYDYEAPVLTCYDADSKLGLRFDAQKAVFDTPSNQNFATQYYENSYIEIETEVWPKVPDPDIDKNLRGDRFIMFWVDGVPAGVKAYSENETLTQTNAKTIEIGSDLCDVYVYVAKAYERRLTEDEHLSNFIMDAPSTNKMLDRYHRNDILDNRGDISYEKLIANNPECHAYLYEVPHVTTSKDDKVDGCTYHELWGEYNTLAKPYYSSSDVRTYVQGTSSAAYGVAAFNLRSKFGSLLDKDGNEVDGWAVSDTAIPIEIACTKVNVASCENCNNVVNQEWYHKFQPYHDAHRRQTREDGKVYRDTMEFNTGVVFIKDLNTETNYYGDDGKPSREGYLNANTFGVDTDNYTSAPYYKQYAIGNMGNDKKNADVFHAVNNPKACCVEVADNQNAEHWMTVPTDLSQFDLKDPYYEFRWPDGNDADNLTTEMKQAWVDFVNWMAASNPKGGNDEYILKATPVTLTDSTYKKNVYFIVNDDGYYEKAVDDFNAETTYYNITAGVQNEGDVEIGVVFEPYTFKGFDPPGYEGTNSPTGITLKNNATETLYSTTKVTYTPQLDANGDPILNDEGQYIMIPQYSIVPYTHDTFDYRMAKMLSECEDHLVMDSVVYHYLFIQRHTMVDNVAKNTFWSTEDLQHWDLTKDYDNDTADGNDNSGYLSFTYGLECMDKTSGGKDIFNASSSVWFNFIHGLPEAQQYLHKQLENKGAWKASDYLAECKRHQLVIPERCWIYDYFRKYIRPRRLGLDETTYLERLEGGMKVHQRTQYETYQEFYLNSKYVAGTAFTDGASIDLRLNKDPSGVWNEDNVLPMSFYIDCYATLHLGGNLKTSERLKRGVKYEAPVGEMVQSPSDATCYIYGASMLQTLEGLSSVYPNYANLNTAGKLREIAFGSSDSTYYNPNLKAPDIGSNAMLQKVQIQRSGIPDGLGSLILKTAYQLKEIYLGGSTVTELELADGSTVHTMELNPLTTLTLSNLSHLTTLTMDEEIDNTITNMYITKCPALDPYTYKWAKSSQLNRYQLNDFNWVIESDDSSYDLTSDFEVEDGVIVGIHALNNLNDDNTRPKDQYTTATGLTGTLTINVPCSVDEFTLYSKYVTTYPNLIINYGDQAIDGVTPAAEIIFWSADEKLEQHYRVLGQRGTAEDGIPSIADLISANGPTGVAMVAPYRESTVDQTFTFTGYWIDSNGNKYYNPADFVGTPTNATSFEAVYPSGNMEFYPEYITAARTYNVRFYDWEGNLIPQVKSDGTTVTAWPVAYNTLYDGPIQNYYYRDSSNLGTAKRWAFKGWSQYNYGDVEIKNPSYFDLAATTITNDIILYGHYLEEDCYINASRLEYFTISGNTISINNNYREVLAGKITLPAITGVTTIGDFANMPEITHVFFEVDGNYTAVGNGAFAQTDEHNINTKLVLVDLPDTITTIGSNAFVHQTSLENVTLNDNITIIGSQAFKGSTSTALKVAINGLPAKLISLGSQAFWQGGPNIVITSLPDGLTEVPSYAFTFCPNVKISEFGSNSSTGSQLAIIGERSFYAAGAGSIGDDVTNIIFNNTVTTINYLAFDAYAKNTLDGVYFVNAESYYNTADASMMGLSHAKDIVYSFTGEIGG